MSRHYFFYGTLIGLVVAFAIASAMLGRHFMDLLLWGRDQKYIGSVPILIGTLAALALAFFLDRNIGEHGFVKSGMLLPLAIFLAGVLVGCATNAVVNGRAQDFYDYFVKPFFWLAGIGVPASLVIGSVYYWVLGQSAPN